MLIWSRRSMCVNLFYLVEIKDVKLSSFTRHTWIQTTDARSIFARMISPDPRNHQKMVTQSNYRGTKACFLGSYQRSSLFIFVFVKFNQSKLVIESIHFIIWIFELDTNTLGLSISIIVRSFEYYVIHIIIRIS